MIAARLHKITAATSGRAPTPERAQRERDAQCILRAVATRSRAQSHGVHEHVRRSALELKEQHLQIVQADVQAGFDANRVGRILARDRLNGKRHQRRVLAGQALDISLQIGTGETGGRCVQKRFRGGSHALPAGLGTWTHAGFELRERVAAVGEFLQRARSALHGEDHEHHARADESGERGKRNHLLARQPRQLRQLAHRLFLLARGVGGEPRLDVVEEQRTVRASRRRGKKMDVRQQA